MGKLEGHRFDMVLGSIVFFLVSQVQGHRQGCR